MKKYIILFALLSSLCAYSQEDDNNKFVLNPWDNNNGTRYAIGYHKDFEAEFSYLLTSWPDTELGFGAFVELFHYIGAGLEYVKDGPRHAVGPKLSYELTFNLLAAQIGIDYLVSESGSQARILPKLGISCFGILTLYYSFNKNLISGSKLYPDTHTISLQLNLPD